MIGRDKFLLLLLAGIVISPSIHAATPAASPSDSATLQYNRRETEKVLILGGGRARVWVRYTLTGTTLETLVQGDRDYKSYDYTRVLLEVDCTKRRLRTATSTDYSTTGKILQANDTPKEYALPVSGSDDEKTLKSVCGAAR